MTPEFGYCFKPGKNRDDCSGALHLWIGHYGVTRYVPTTYDVRCEEWNDAAGRLIVPDHATARTRKLAECARSMARNLRLVETIVADLEGSRKRFTADDVANAYNRAVSGTRMLGVYASVAAEDALFCGYPRAAKGYDTSTRRFIAWNGGYDLDMSTITPQMMREFQQSLVREQVSRNTVSFYMRTLRTLYNKAVAEGIIAPSTDSPFDEVYTGVILTGERGTARPKN